jgi:hypothetical protein
LQPNVKPVRKRNGLRLEPIISGQAWVISQVWGKENLRHHRLVNRARADVTKWPHQGMRHSFCSYWLALHKDVNELVMQSGHDDPDTMWRHYHKGTRRAEAVKFWTINPPHRQPRKIIPSGEQATAGSDARQIEARRPHRNSLVVLAEGPPQACVKAKLTATFSEGYSLTASVPQKSFGALPVSRSGWRARFNTGISGAGRCCNWSAL